MSDPIPHLLRQIQGWAAALEANWDETVGWLNDLRPGHPRAQDFEPTGHGGSDPTASNGIRPDVAALDRKDIENGIRAAWRGIDAAHSRAKRYQNAERPKAKEADLSDLWCVIHWQLGYPEPRAHLDLCDPCYRYKVNHNGEYPTKGDVEYYIAHYGKWPSKRIDPTKPQVDVVRIAGASRLALGTESMTAEQAASVLLNRITTT